MSSFHTRSPIAFAHRGGMADFRQNTLQAFRNAIERGVTGVEADVWLTADGEAVLDHDGVVRSHLGLRRSPIAAMRRSDLPAWIPSLNELYELVGDQILVSLDIKDATAGHRVIEIARGMKRPSTDHLYLAHDGYSNSDWNLVSTWRALDPSVNLVDSTEPKRFDIAANLYAKRAADAGINVINMKGRHWNALLVAQVHSAGLRCFAFGVQRRSDMARLLNIGIDGIYSDHPKRLVECVVQGSD